MAKRKETTKSDQPTERGRLLRRARMAAGLSATDVAKEIGVTPAAVSSWELGKRNPQPRLIPAYAAALKITPNELLDILEKQ